ncbi:MAG: glycosyltransferase family 2 protein [Candidatus Humimicrobiaceae bacterium]
MDTKVLLKYGKLGKKTYYFFEVLKSLRSKIIKCFRKVFGINEVSWKKIKKFIIKKDINEFRNIDFQKKPTLSVILTCYNHANYLQKVFESIMNQTEYPDEVIIINDFSSDNTSEILDELMRSNKEKINLKLINNENNIGQSECLNKAISRSYSDLVMILNDDDYLFYDAIEVVKSIANTHKDIFMIGSTSIHFNNDSILNDYEKYILRSQKIENIKILIQKPENVKNYKNYNDLNMTHSGCTFYKNVWEFVGEYFSNKRERVVPFSDRDFQLRVNAFFNVGILYDTPLIFWRSNSSVDYGKNT